MSKTKLSRMLQRLAVFARGMLSVACILVTVAIAAPADMAQIGDETAVNALSQALSGMKKKKTAPADEFLMRSAAHSLGQIRSRAGLPALIAALSNDQNPPDVRREAAASLGLIGDPSAAPSLRAALDSSDPYLVEAARQALRKLATARN